LVWTSAEKFLLSSLLPTAASSHRLRRLLQQQPSTIDWEVVRSQGRHLQILPLVRHNLIHPFEDPEDLSRQLPLDLQSFLRRQAEEWAARELAYVQETRTLIGLLQAQGIPSLPLKGAALMLGGYYPQPGLRPAVDIDLLVASKDVHAADALLARYHYQPLPGKRHVRPNQRLPNQRNHLWPRRGPSGIIIELHHRAFEVVPHEEEIGFAELWSRARSIGAGFLPLPSPGDLALHLIHHSMVDLQSGHSILRTLADLYFLAGKAPETLEQARRLAAQLGFSRIVQLAEQALHHLEVAHLEALEVDAAHPDLALLLETAMLPSHHQLAEAARFFEYFNFSRRPLARIRTLAGFLTPPREHLDQLYPSATQASRWNYLRRPIDLVRRIDWGSLRPSVLRRVRQWKRLPDRRD
jgi:hypothetical protein